MRRCRFAFTIVAWASALIGSLLAVERASAYCSLETSPCYRWDRYSALNGIFCRHWHYGAFDNSYLIGLAPGISPAQYLSAVQVAKSNWESASTSALPDFSHTVSSPVDTTGVSYWLWVDDATWSSRQFNPNAAGLTYKRVDGLGVVLHGRTWLHQRPLVWRWSPDCLTDNCAGDVFTKPGLDLPSIVTHEFGHWWVLLDVATVGCEHVLMWGTTSTNTVRRTIQFPDAIGAVLLYDQPVGTSTSLVRATATARSVDLEWFASDEPGSTHVVERRDPGGRWNARSTVSSDGSGVVRWRDVEVNPGQRFGYRLCEPGGPADGCSSESVVEIPASRVELALLGRRGLSLDVQLELASYAPATLDLYDVAGRRLRQFEVGSFGPGPHVLRVASEGELPAGLFWLRLRQGDQAITRVASITP